MSGQTPRGNCTNNLRAGQQERSPTATFINDPTNLKKGGRLRAMKPQSAAEEAKLTKWGQYWYHKLMSAVQKILTQMRREPNNVRFTDLIKVCKEFFGEPRQSGSSHIIFKTPWAGDPRINIQNDKGKAKAYQVKQVLLAIDKLEHQKNES